MIKWYLHLDRALDNNDSYNQGCTNEKKLVSNTYKELYELYL